MPHNVFNHPDRRLLLFQFIGHVKIKEVSTVPLSNGNWTERSTIQGVIGRVISNRPSA